MTDRVIVCRQCDVGYLTMKFQITALRKDARRGCPEATAKLKSLGILHRKAAA